MLSNVTFMIFAVCDPIPWTIKCDEASQNLHSLNASFNLQIRSNANLITNAALVGLKQVSASSVEPNKQKMHCITLSTFVVNRWIVVLLL